MAGEDKNSKGKFLLSVDDGSTVNDLLMLIQADLLGRPVVRQAGIETTPLGVASAAGLAVGVWTCQIFQVGFSRQKKTLGQHASQVLANDKADWCLDRSDLPNIREG